jgi:hypothetical protein
MLRFSKNSGHSAQITRVHFDDEAGHLFDFADRSFAVEPAVPIYCCGPV